MAKYDESLTTREEMIQTVKDRGQKADFLARKILAGLAGGTVNDSANSLTRKFIFGGEENIK